MNIPKGAALAWALFVLPAQAATVGWLRDGSATYADATPPVEWGPGKNIAWKATVGGGYSSPIVAGNFVIVASEPDVVTCVDIATGKAVWSTSTPVTALPKEQQDIVLPSAGQAGNMAATPVCDGERVYAMFAIGIVAAFDLKTGKRLWTKAINAPLRGDGRSGSPVRAADLAIVQLGELYAFDAKSGAIRWKQEEAQEGYGTPLVTKIGADEVVLLPKGAVVRVSDGKLLASLDASLKYASPCLAGNKICFVDTSINIFDLPEKIADPLALNLHWSDSLDGEFYSTPLFHGGLLYTLETHGKLSILDAKNKTKSEKQLELEEIIYPSPVLAGKYIFVGNNKGKTIVLEPGKDAKIVKINELGDGSGATPAFSGKKIFIRSGDDLFCIEGK